MEGLANALQAIAQAAHYSAILVAAIAAFLVGWIWYAAFGGIWRRGIDEAPRRDSIRLYLLIFFADLVMATMLQGVLVHSGLWGVKNGMISAIFLWIGFVATSVGVSETFLGRPRSVIAIDLGHWLAAMLAMGAIIGAFGPA